MNAVVVEAIPALTFGALAVAVEIGLALSLIDEVVLAGHVMHVELGLPNQLGGIVELVRLGEVGDVAGVDHEGGTGLHVLGLGDRLVQRPESVRIGRLVEADMAVADLQEGEARGVCGERIAEQT
jgi:hypothetical protein